MNEKELTDEELKTLLYSLSAYDTAVLGRRIQITKGLPLGVRHSFREVSWAEMIISLRDRIAELEAERTFLLARMKELEGELVVKIGGKHNPARRGPKE